MRTKPDYIAVRIAQLKQKEKEYVILLCKLNQSLTKKL